MTVAMTFTSTLKGVTKFESRYGTGHYYSLRFSLYLSHKIVEGQEKKVPVYQTIFCIWHPPASFAVNLKEGQLIQVIADLKEIKLSIYNGRTEPTVHATALRVSEVLAQVENKQKDSDSEGDIADHNNDDILSEDVPF